MNAPAVIFASAYKQLSTTERQFVEAVVAELEAAAHRSNERIILALNRPIPQTIVDRSNGLLDRAMVRAAITERISQISADQDLTVDRWLKEQMSIAFSNISNYMKISEDGEVIFDVIDCTPEQMAAVQSIDFEQTGDGFTRPVKTRIKLRLYDKMSALDRLGRYMGVQDSENPHWRAEMAALKTKSLPENASTEDASNAYAEMIG